MLDLPKFVRLNNLEWSKKTLLWTVTRLGILRFKKEKVCEAQIQLYFQGILIAKDYHPSSAWTILFFFIPFNCHFDSCFLLLFLSSFLLSLSVFFLFFLFSLLFLFPCLLFQKSIHLLIKHPHIPILHPQKIAPSIGVIFSKN